MDIREDDPRRPEISGLLRAHMAYMEAHTPPESIFALDAEGLCAPEITFWSAWQDDELVGCGALRELTPEHGEIKSMHAVQHRRGEGIGKRILGFIVGEAERRGYARLSLETGSMDGFQPARAFYAAYGFEPCGPFGSYTYDPLSVYMTLELRD